MGKEKTVLICHLFHSSRNQSTTPTSLHTSSICFQIWNPWRFSEYNICCIDPLQKNQRTNRLRLQRCRHGWLKRVKTPSSRSWHDNTAVFSPCQLTSYLDMPDTLRRNFRWHIMPSLEKGLDCSWIETFGPYECSGRMVSIHDHRGISTSHCALGESATRYLQLNAKVRIHGRYGCRFTCLLRRVSDRVE